MERTHAGQPVPPGAHEAHGAAVAVEESHPKAGLYVGIFLILFVVTALEVAVTYFPAIPQLPSLLALAVLKFGLIAAFYMHLRFDSRVFSAFFLTGLILAAGLLFSLLALFTAHYREPYEPAAQEQTTGTPAAGTPAAGTPAAGAAR
ncbi:MAG: cytochrome C oxidase subunit IV family protein [Chloroflexota bacterium]